MVSTSPWSKFAGYKRESFDDLGNDDKETLRNDITQKTICDVLDVIEKSDKLIPGSTDRESMAFVLNVLTTCLTAVVRILSDLGLKESARIELADMVRDRLLDKDT